MMPYSVKDAWARARYVPQDDDLPAMAELPDSNDVVLRRCMVTLTILAVMTALWIAKSVALPLVAGLIFGLVLGPLVDRLIRLGLAQSAAASVVVICGVLMMVTIVGIFAAPFAIWSDQLPGIVSALRSRFTDLAALIRQFEGVTKSMSNPVAAPVVQVEGENNWLSLALSSSAVAGSLLIFIATIYFYLATRRHLKARALRLCFGAASRRAAGQFLEDIEDKLGRYFAIVTVINLGVGLSATAIAWLAGLPFPWFWGLLALILNYIAFVGPIIMAGLLLGAGLIDPTNTFWSAWPAVLFYIVHLIEANLVTPLMVGRHLTLSPFLVFVSFVFWLWLWGPVGAILSVPLLLLMSLSLETAAAYRQIHADQQATATSGGTGA